MAESQLREHLEWLLKRRYGCKEVIDVIVPPASVTAFCLTDRETERFFAVVVDTLKVRSVETLACNVARYVNDPSAHVECIIVYREKCTQQKSQRHRARTFSHADENMATVTCHVFSEESICSHPLRFSIVPQDYRVVVEGTEEHNDLLKKTKGDLTQLPWMRESDKAAHLLGYRAGQVIAHMETRGILPAYVDYRIMVAADENA